jgi:hypothetical protein
MESELSFDICFFLLNSVQKKHKYKKEHKNCYKTVRTLALQNHSCAVFAAILFSYQTQFL